MAKTRDAAEQALCGIDRLVRNVRTGHFERTLSALTAVGGVITAVEIYLAHDRASFGNRMMWVPVVLNPIVAAAGVAGVFSRRLAKTALPLTSAMLVANGLQGTTCTPGGSASGRAAGRWRATTPRPVRR